ncbi:MAG TPA: hypothetical protein PKL08_09570 [Thermoanaerobaculaceae bacterium]|nr:hypothetical protein [Thermoanaerobaculaceae bacterium]
MTRADVLTLIRDTARRPPGLFRVHHTRPDLYARARRMFGSWAAAVSAAGLYYEAVLRSAQLRSARGIPRSPRSDTTRKGPSE